MTIKTTGRYRLRVLAQGRKKKPRPDGEAQEMVGQPPQVVTPIVPRAALLAEDDATGCTNPYPHHRNTCNRGSIDSLMSTVERSDHTRAPYGT